jgi:hypothetical protein
VDKHVDNSVDDGKTLLRWRSAAGAGSRAEGVGWRWRLQLLRIFFVAFVAAVVICIVGIRASATTGTQDLIHASTRRSKP